MPETSHQTNDYLNFEVTIRKQGHDYLARVTDAPTRRESEENKLELPFGASEIPVILLRLENAVLRSAGSYRGTMTSKDERMLQDFGREMYKAVFVNAPDILEEYAASLALVDEQRDRTMGLRIRLRVESPDLAALPWEFLYDKRERSYVCLRNKTPLVRFLNARKTSHNLEVDGPLRILGMIVNPGMRTNDASFGEDFDDWELLNTDAERTRIDEAIAPLEKEGRVRFQWVPGESPRQLLAMMRKEPWHVFHFIGHGGIGGDDPIGNGKAAEGEGDTDGYIVMTDDHYRPMEIPARKLYRLLEGFGSLRLAVLNCCYSARATSSDAFASPGAALVRAGVPAVVAMQYPISDQAAIELASGFYGSLADGFPVDTALTQARILVSFRSDFEWGVPVLYMRSPNGQLFSTAGAKALENGTEDHNSSEPEGPPLPTPDAGQQEEAQREEIDGDGDGDGVDPDGVDPDAIEPDPLLAFWAQIKMGRPPDNGSSSPAVRAVEPEQQATETPELVAEFELVAEIAQSLPAEELSRGELDEFIDRYGLFATQQPENQPVRTKLAAAYRRRAQLRFAADPKLAGEAMGDLSHAITLDPSGAQHYYERAKLYGSTGDYRRALLDLEQALKAEPHNAEYLWTQGVILSLVAISNDRRQDQSRAIEAISRAIALSPNTAKFYHSRAGAYKAQRLYTKALWDMDKAIELAPGNLKYVSHRDRIMRHASREPGF